MTTAEKIFTDTEVALLSFSHLMMTAITYASLEEEGKVLFKEKLQTYLHERKDELESSEREILEKFTDA